MLYVIYHLVIYEDCITASLVMLHRKTSRMGTIVVGRWNWQELMDGDTSRGDM